MSLTNSSLWFSSDAGGYQINDSLRFEDGSGAYLYRTPAVAGNRKTWTFSCWFKRGNLGLTYPTIFSTNDIDPGQYTSIIFYNEALYLNASGFGANYTLITNQVLRDVSSWYHLVWSVDTTQATSTDRMKLYINGEQVTSFSTATYPSLNKDLDVNATTLHTMGYFADYGRYWDGYLSDIYLIDGQALDPTDFGETIDGYWRPLPYAGTYGTNGFHLDFNGNTNDASGNGNNWTAAAISAHDYVPDSPTNNFATLNSIEPATSTAFSEGNLKATATASTWNAQAGTFFVSSGKWYAEVYNVNGNGSSLRVGVGIAEESYNPVSYLGQYSDSWGWYDTGTVYNNASVSSNESTYTAGDILGIGLDLDTNTVSFYKNGTLDFSKSISAGNWGIATSTYFSSSSAIINFGQDSTFVGATTAGGNTDGKGKGDFKYAPPSGYLAFCSANLPDSTIGPGQTALAKDYFVPYLYTADNTSPKSRTGMGFSPDFLWFKDRTTSFSNGLYDTVRGIPYQLQSNNTSAENSYTLLDSFDADGFTTTSDGTAGNVLNYTTDSYVTWAWKAGGTAVSNTSGSTASNVSANTDAGFSIVTWFANAATGTVGHGLNSAPELVIAKPRDDSGTNWYVMHTGALTASQVMNLDTTGAAYTPGVAHFNSTYPTSSVISYGGYLGNALTYNNKVAYCFHSVDGYSKVGSYFGNGSSNGPMVYTGFRPSFILTKRSNGTSWWGISDSNRSPFNEVANTLAANESYSESVLTSDMKVDFLSNGFKIRDTDGYYNASGGNYIYLAFAETPFKYANAR